MQFLLILLLTLNFFSCSDKKETPQSTKEVQTPKTEEIKRPQEVEIPDLELPKITEKDQIIKHTYYTLSYNEKYEQANWVAHKLTKEMTQGNTKRKDNFREDKKVKTGSASLKDYKKSGYDRGHLLPAADMKFSNEAMSETFFMSNMSPQHKDLNRGIWKKLEEQVRDWVEIENELYIVTGPIFGERNKRIGENEVAVPPFYYKAILDYSLPERKAIAFVMPNRKPPKRAKLRNYFVNIDSLETLTGIDFFPALPDSEEEKLESWFDRKLWGF